MTEAVVGDLVTLLRRFSPEEAECLLCQIENLKVCHNPSRRTETLIQTLKDLTQKKISGSEEIPAHMDSIGQAYFKPFLPLFEAGNLSELLPGNMPRVIIRPAWHVIAKKIALPFMTLNAKSMEEAICDGATEKLQTKIDELHDYVIERFEEGEGYIVLNKLEPCISPEMAQRLYYQMKILQYGRKFGFSFDGEIDIQAASNSEKLTEFIWRVGNEKVELILELMLIFMAKSHKPWQVVRLLTKFSRYTDDKKLSTSAFDVIGDRLFVSLDRIIDSIEKATSHIRFDGYNLAERIEDYNKLNHGFEREGIMAHDGPWRRKLVAVRARAGKLFNDLCTKSLRAIQSALPIQRTYIRGAGQISIPLTNVRIDPEIVGHAIDFVNLIVSSRLYAPLAGFSAARDAAQDSLTRHLASIKNGMFTLVSLERMGEFFDDWVDATLNLALALEGEDSHKILKRRLVEKGANVRCAFSLIMPT